MKDFKRLEDYGVIGNLEVCALVGRDGSIDWCCFPYLDSPSVFGAILDPEKGGYFQVKPKGRFDSHQAYVGTTNVLNTVFDACGGSAVITDFMPVLDKERDPGDNSHRMILRKLTCTRGRLDMDLDFRPCFDYGLTGAELHEVDGGILASAKDESLFLQMQPAVQLKEGRARCSFETQEGMTHWMVVQYGQKRPMARSECEDLLERTVKFWMDWLHTSDLSRPIFTGPWHELVMRSSLILKLLTSARTGAIAASPTTSLPESPGGVRNWDYRYSWVRDSAFTVQTFVHLGHLKEAMAYFLWLKKSSHAYEKDQGPSNLRIAYALHGKDIPREEELSHLTGYRNSSPVRVGNAAFEQNQWDIYGELVNTFYVIRFYEKKILEEDWQFLHRLADYVCEVWDRKDSGIWEFRTPPKHYTHSKLMCWVALDRCIRMAEENELRGAVDKWKQAASKIRNAILEKGFSKSLNSFVQAFDSEDLDATSLMIPVMGLLSPTDPRVAGTIDAIMKELYHEGLVCRYKVHDGLPGEEGTFTICSFWLVRALAMAGRVEEAQDVLLKVLRYKSPLGLFSEEIDPRSGSQIGNFPQAFSHLGLISAVLYLGKAMGKEGEGPTLL